MMWFVVATLVVLFGFVVFFGAPYVPSQRKYVQRAFEHFKLGPDDVLVDGGSGDGVVLRIAADYGARAIGYEINPVLVAVSKLLSFSNEKIDTKLANFWNVRLPDDTTIIYAFAVSRDEARLVGIVQREANRLGRPLKLLCHGSPLKKRQPVESFDAYHLYIFQPLQLKKA